MNYYKNLHLTDIKYFCKVDQVEKVEQWLPVIGFENYYEISNLGRIKSLGRVLTIKNYKYIKKTIIKSQSFNKQGYCIISFCVGLKKQTTTVHILVAIHFNGYIRGTKKYVVDHIDNVRTNNINTNLQQLTYRANTSKHIKPKTTKYTGVYIKNKKIASSIVIDKKTYFLGYFSSEESASEAYKLAVYNWENNKEIPIRKKVIYKQVYVSFYKSKNKWRAQKRVNKIIKHIGYFDSEQEAYKSII